MLVPAMAFVWCVLSAEQAETQKPTHHETTTQAVAHAKPALGPSASMPSTASHAGQRTPIRGPIPAEVIAYAKTLVNLPMGTEQIAEIDGQRYVFVLERHYHPPGFVGALNGWHKGV